MKTVRFYDETTGIFTGAIVNHSDPEQLKPPPGHKAFEGECHEMHAKRVDVSTGELVDWQPPAPSADHEWDDSTKRWKPNQAMVDRQAHHAHAHGRIRQLADTERHLIRKLILTATSGPQSAPIAKARAELQAIEDEIAGLQRDG